MSGDRTGNHKRVIEDIYLPDVYKYVDAKCSIVFYDKESFGKNIDNQVRVICYHRGVNGAALPLDIIKIIAHNHAEKGMTINLLKGFFGEQGN